MVCTDVPVELGNMSPHLAKAMLVVENMPILKRINVMVEIIRSKVILNFGYAAAIATEGYICALVDFAVKSKVGASIELDCPILGLRVLCMFFSIAGSKKTCQRKFNSDFTRALRKCLSYKLQRPII